jgi:hypothetical protein
MLLINMDIIRSQFSRQNFSRTIFVLIGIVILIFSIANFYEAKPRPRGINEVPIAFWAWRVNVPNDADIDAAFKATKAKTLFLRAGQIDFEKGEFKRIQAVKGNFPRALDLHLVYNATRKFLTEFENLDLENFAKSLAGIYQEDLAQADQDQATIAGIQLDLDVPTRLLPRYAQALTKLKDLLPPKTKLSITGLPTWANSSDIHSVLSVVDFWIPQCYGTEIPNRITKQIPISSPSNVARIINKIRQLKKPFYAGLSAYSYAILYGKDGTLIELRGDLDPAAAAQNKNMKLQESANFKGDEANGERRYVYRAKSDFVFDGLIMKAGESLVFDLPSAESLRECARAVRENAGENLLGICLFRLPSNGDETVLSLNEITVAVNDQPSTIATKITLYHDKNQRLNLVAENVGTASALNGEGALTIDLAIPVGSLIEEIMRTGFTESETLCQMLGQDFARPCSQRRANVIRLKTNSWKPGGDAQMTWAFYDEVPKKIAATVRTKMNDGNLEIEKYEIEMRDENEK